MGISDPSWHSVGAALPLIEFPLHRVNTAESSLFLSLVYASKSPRGSLLSIVADDWSLGDSPQECQRVVMQHPEKHPL